MGFFTWHPFPSLGSGTLLSPWEITPFFSLTYYDYDRVDFISNSRSGHVAQSWPIGALISSRCVDIIQPVTVWKL